MKLYTYKACLTKKPNYPNLHFMVKSVLRDFFSFLKEPSLQESQITTLNKVFKTIQIIAFQAFIMVVAGVFVTFLLNFFNWNGTNTIDDVASKSLFILLIFAVIWAPIAEEFAFRGWLSKSRSMLSFGLSFLVFFSLQIVFSYIHFNIHPTVLLIIVLAITITVWAMVYFGLQKNNLQNKTNLFIDKHFGKLLYLSAIIFGVAHIGNFNDLNNLIWLTPLIILPQFLGGLTLGYIRIRFGIIYSIIAHAFNNLIAFLALYSQNSLSQPVSQALKNNQEYMSLATSNDQIILVITGIFTIFYFTFIIVMNIYNLIEIKQK